MRNALWIAVAAITLSLLQTSAQDQTRASASTYLGFDRNDYPGDDALPTLHKTFSYAGYWLNNAPGSHSNTWRGKRKVVEENGFGFLVLFNGRLYNELKKDPSVPDLGRRDAAAAIAAAKQEGFPAHTIIFLDQEQGGRMLPEQRAYIQSWIDGVNASGYRAGVYCSGIGAKEQETGLNVIAAEDIYGLSDNRDVTFWVTNDACPPSPGCSFAKAPQPTDSGLRFAEVWQFAQSPKRPDVAAKCPANYDRDGSCYAPGFATSRHMHVDVDAAISADPSNGRTKR
jgi:hypothetical protein